MSTHGFWHFWHLFFLISEEVWVKGPFPLTLEVAAEVICFQVIHSWGVNSREHWTVNFHMILSGLLSLRLQDSWLANVSQSCGAAWLHPDLVSRRKWGPVLQSHTNCSELQDADGEAWLPQMTMFPGLWGAKTLLSSLKVCHLLLLSSNEEENISLLLELGFRSTKLENSFLGWTGAWVGLENYY